VLAEIGPSEGGEPMPVVGAPGQGLEDVVLRPPVTAQLVKVDKIRAILTHLISPGYPSICRKRIRRWQLTAKKLANPAIHKQVPARHYK
jgi:hypothetical protein